MGSLLFALAHFHALCSSTSPFFVLFVSLCYKWHPCHWACFNCISRLSSFFFLVKFDKPYGSTSNVCWLVSFGVAFRVFITIKLGALGFWVFLWDPFPSHPFYSWCFGWWCLTRRCPSYVGGCITFGIFTHRFTSRLYYFLCSFPLP